MMWFYVTLAARFILPCCKVVLQEWDGVMNIFHYRKFTLNTIKKCLMVIIFFTMISVSTFAYTSSISAPIGWSSSHITMASIAEGIQNKYNWEKLIKRMELLPSSIPNAAIFTYAEGGGADTYNLHEYSIDQKAQHLIAMSRALEQNTGKSIMPVLVVYTNGASSSTTAMNIDFGFQSPNPPAQQDNLKLRFYNLIAVCQYLESQKDLAHPHPATILLNPDFLGELHKVQNGSDWAPAATQAISKNPTMAYTSFHIKQSFDDALSDLHLAKPEKEPACITNKASLDIIHIRKNIIWIVNAECLWYFLFFLFFLFFILTINIYIPHTI